jgi:serine/threonine protein kinase
MVSEKKKKWVESGSESCIYHPSIPCSEKIEVLKEVKQSVGKVFLETKDAKREWNIAKQLFQIDPKQTYYIYPTTYCKVSTDTFPTDSCVFLTENTQKLSELKMKHVSNNLMEYSIKKKKRVSTEWFLKNILHTLHGLEKLHQHGYIHNDIKYNNVMVDQDQWKLIDFGISLEQKDYYDLQKNVSLYTDYMIHPPEIRYYMRYYYLEKEIESPVQFIENEWYLLHFMISETRQRNIDIYKLYFEYSTYRDALQRFFKKVKYMSKRKLKKEMTKQVEKVDIYSLGLMLSQIYLYTNIQVNEEAFLIYSLIQHMIHPNMYERWSLPQCIRYVQQLLKTPS